MQITPPTPSDPHPPPPRPRAIASTFPWQPLFFKTLLLGSALAASLWLVVRLRVVTAPILIGFFIAYALNPLVVRLRRWRVPPVLALTVPVAAVMSLALVFAVFVLPQMARDFLHASESTPGSLYNYVLRADPWVEQLSGRKLSDVIPYRNLSGTVQALAGALIGPAQSQFAALVSSARDLAVAAGKLLLVIVVAFFLLDDYERAVRTIDSLLPRRHVAEVRRVVDRIDDVMAGFVRGQLLLFGLATCVLTGGMAALDVPFWLVMGPLAAVLYLVPYVGVVSGAALTVLLQLLANADGWRVVAAIGLFALFYAVDLIAITPRMIGNRVGLPPLAVLLGIIAFGELFGVIGVLLAVPLLACGRILLLEAIGRYRASTTYLGADPGAVVPAADVKDEP